MRVRTDAKRQSIMSAAADVFRELGYERASMELIARRVGGSKATLYGYFASKEELFADVMLAAMDGQAEEIFNLLDSRAGDMRGVLTVFGTAYLDFLLMPDVIAGLRIGIAEGAGELGRLLYERGTKAGWTRFSQFIADAVGSGRLREVYPWIAAMQFKGLLEIGLYEPALFGADALFPRKVVVEAAVSAFLMAYQIDEADAESPRSPGR